jgi:transcriptional regulator with XRE-family HTH domain
VTPRLFSHDKMRELRLGLGLTLAEVARRIAQATQRRCNAACVTRWEHGENPGADYVMGIATALGATPNDLYENFGTSVQDLVAEIEGAERRWGISFRARKLRGERRRRR